MQIEVLVLGGDIVFALTPPGGHAGVKNLKQIPSFTERMPQINAHPKGGCLSCLGICLLLFLCLVSPPPPDSSYVPLLLDTLQTKLGHRRGL